ncbi:VOC family protein [Actinocorallia lasiicapitis]
MELRLKHCFVPVLDHTEALAFYCDALGLEVRNDVGFENMRWVTIGPKGQPDMDIVLEPPLASPDASQEDRDAYIRMIVKGLIHGLVFTTDDVDAMFAQVAEAGGEVVQEPMDQPYGVRDCAFRDPSGNLIRINQPNAR